jgi:fatty acid desaturase 1 (delta-5 desaturase)
MQDLTWAMAYFFRFWVTYTLAGGWQRMIALYFTMRIIESSWFAWISAMSHFPMVRTI